MTKEHLKKILDKYKNAENEVVELDNKFGIQIWNSRTENFYNKFNYVIFELISILFTEQGRELIENYLFDQINITFDELYETLQKYAK